MSTIHVNCLYCGQNKMSLNDKHNIGIVNGMELRCATCTITNDCKNIKFYRYKEKLSEIEKEN